MPVLPMKDITDVDNVVLVNKDGLVYLQFKNLKKYENEIIHCFTTRLGGVSKDSCFSLNLGDKPYDSIENVEENFNRLCRAIGIKRESLVFSNQVHGTHIRKVNDSGRNYGIIDRKKAEPHDGLMTNVRGISLVTFYADCVPVLFFDYCKKVIAMAHSGWRGTVSEIAAITVKELEKQYNCKPGNLEVAIGPSIGKCCFEVGEEVYLEFLEKLPWSMEFCHKTGSDKWHIDLQGIVTQSLINSGVARENICNAALCTKCNKDIFYSHRGDNGKTGSMAAIMQIK